MIYLIYGKDTYRSRRKFAELISYFKNKSSTFAFFNIEGDNFSAVLVEELLRSQSLFEKKHIVVLNRVFENASAGDFIEKNIKEISASSNIFLFWEEEVKQGLLKNISEFIQKSQEFEPLDRLKVKNFLKEESKKAGLKIDISTESEIIEKYGSDLWGIKSEIEKFASSNHLDVRHSNFGYSTSKWEKINLFHLTDAFGRKDKKRAWVLYQKALLSGLPAEEVFWKLSWQVKNILLVKRMSEEYGKDLKEIIKEGKLNSFVAGNCLNFAKDFEIDKLTSLYSDLVDVYHKVRRGKADFEVAVEKFLLSY